MKNLYFASGEKVTPRLRRPYLKMLQKVRKFHCSYALIELHTKCYSVPVPGGAGETTILNLIRQMRGKFHGLILCW